MAVPVVGSLLAHELRALLRQLGADGVRAACAVHAAAAPAAGSVRPARPLLPQAEPATRHARPGAVEYQAPPQQVLRPPIAPVTDADPGGQRAQAEQAVDAPPTQPDTDSETESAMRLREAWCAGAEKSGTGGTQAARAVCLARARSAGCQTKQRPMPSPGKGSATTQGTTAASCGKVVARRNRMRQGCPACWPASRPCQDMAAARLRPGCSARSLPKGMGACCQL